MKKSMIVAMCMAGMAMAGETAPVAVTPIQTPAVAPAPVACPLSVEVAGVYTAALNDVVTGIDGIDTWGVDLTFVYDLCPNWSVNLRGGWANGDDDDNDLETTVWSIMPGVRYTAPITEELSWFAGANIGAANVEYEQLDVSEDEWGFAYSAELGLRYDLTENLYVFGAVQGNGNLAEPLNAAQQYGVGARAGLGWKF